MYRHFILFRTLNTHIIYHFWIIDAIRPLNINHIYNEHFTGEFILAVLAPIYSCLSDTRLVYTLLPQLIFSSLLRASSAKNSLAGLTNEGLPQLILEMNNVNIDSSSHIFRKLPILMTTETALQGK